MISNPFISFQFKKALALIALSPLAGLSYGQYSTDPMGFIKLTVPANSDTTIGQPLHREPEYSSNGTVNGSTVNVSGGLTANQFAYSPPSQNKNYYLLVKTPGAFNGRYFDVLSNTSNQITLDTNIQALGLPSTIQFQLIPYHTLQSYFPNGQGVGVTNDIFEPSGLVMFVSQSIGVNRPASSFYFYYQGSEESGTGWYSNNDISLGLQNDITIDPHIPIQIRNLQSFVKTVVIKGNVPLTTAISPIRTAAVNHDNHLSIQFPVDTTLAQSGFANTAIRATDDIFEPVDVILFNDDIASGKNKASSKVFFYYNGTEEQGPGWYDNNDISLGLQNNSAVFKSGRTFVIRRKSGTPSFNYISTPIPYNNQ